MDEEASASSLFFHASHDSSQSGAIPPRVTQLAASFRLHEEEIAFFDAVIDSLPRASHAFQQLKRAYDLQSKNPNWMLRIAEALQFSLEETSAVDARLWNTLLALVQVRGQTWAERWDSVRVSLGLDPRNDTERWNLPTDYSFQEQMPESSNTWLATGLSSQSTAARFGDKPLSSMQGMSLATTGSSIETDTSSAFGQNESVIDLQHQMGPSDGKGPALAFTEDIFEMEEHLSWLI
ncbi:hypothetical protein MPSI1_000474 [Malassezia psittaci]|uniref:Uncharacterized protein n=1 Tax=Malassezia psittaci TaxID=1821823 RepID=A0AAF0F3A6_9BASI|nr:hypothetical protein MPSI1_000474 [Malassezia psittaci]